MSYNQERGFSNSGLWTPTDGSGAGLAFTVVANACRWLRTGDLVYACIRLTYPVTADASTAKIAGWPVQWKATDSSVFLGKVASDAGLDLILLLNTGDTNAWFFKGNTYTTAKNSDLSGKQIDGSLLYQAA